MVGNRRCEHFTLCFAKYNVEISTSNLFQISSLLEHKILHHFFTSYAAEKAGYKREDVLKMVDKENRHPMHTAVLSGDLRVGRPMHATAHVAQCVKLT